MRLIRLFKSELMHESKDWVDKGIISEDQAKTICQEYSIDYSKSQEHSLGYNLLVTLGYLFIGLAIITLIGANWDDIPRAVRMVGLIFLTGSIHALGCWRYSQNNEDSAQRFFLLGNLFYGASIILIAQIYHLGEHMPDGVFWWALGTLPFGPLLRSHYLTLFSLVLGIIWLLLETNLGFYPVLFPIFLIAAIGVLTYSKQSFILFITTVAGIGLWIEFALAHGWRTGLHYRWEVEHIVVSACLFAFVYSFSNWMNQQKNPKLKNYGALLGLWCLRFTLLALVIMSFESTWVELIKADWNNSGSMLLISGLFSAAALFVSYHQNKHTTALIGFLLVIFLSVSVVINTTDRAYAIYMQIASNILLLSFGIGLIIKGINAGISHYFYLGTLTILLTGLLRYMDLVGNYVGGALMFGVFAIILLSAAKYWKHHAKSMEVSGNE
jgi:uncharacterized membrane protein